MRIAIVNQTIFIFLELLSQFFLFCFLLLFFYKLLQSTNTSLNLNALWRCFSSRVLKNKQTNNGYCNLFELSIAANDQGSKHGNQLLFLSIFFQGSIWCNTSITFQIFLLSNLHTIVKKIKLFDYRRLVVCSFVYWFYSFLSR